MLHRVDDGVDARRQYGAESREIDMEEDDSADYQQAVDDQQAEAPNFPPVKIKEVKKTRGHISASSLPSNVKEATAI